ncbi:MAG: PEGA domain-containing protein, partial [Desulfobacterales bacterium]|nr:PEGA domain-containing protein [Desulfobacterales bacterium]
VEIVAGKQQQIAITLTPLPTSGFLTVTARAEGKPVSASLTLIQGSQRISGMSGRSIELEQGTWQLQAESEGYEAVRQTVEIVAGKQQQIAITLTPLPTSGFLTVTARAEGKPVSASLTLTRDSQKISEKSGKSIELEQGRWEVLIELENYSAQMKVDIIAGKQMKITRDIVPGLEHLKGQMAIDLSGTPIEDLNQFKDHKELSYLYLRDTNVSDLSPLKNLTDIYTLDLSYTKVTDLNPLKNLNKLYSLDLSYTLVSDLSPLKNLNSLYFLKLKGTQVSDLNSLKNLKNLYLLDLSDTQINDLTPIKNSKSLNTLNLHGTRISREQINYMKKTIPGINITQ